MPKRKLIIFDMDGVLVDSAELASNYLLNIYPTFTRELMSEMLTGNFHEAMEKARLTHIPIKETDEERAERKATYSTQKLEVPLFEGIPELLERLHKKGYILVVNTSALERNSLPILEKTGILKLFDLVATAELSKSKVEKFKIIEEKFGVPNEDVLFVTDTVGDIREAKLAGVSTVAVTWGAHDKSRFNREPSDSLVAIVDTIEELESLICGE